MKKVLAALFVGVFLIGGVGSVFAASTVAEETEALVKKAAAYVKANGKEKALAEFNNPQGQFVKGEELYVFAYDLNGTIIAHPKNPKLVGMDMTAIKDSDGKFFTLDFLKAVKSPAGKGWVEYRWTNPKTKKIQPKASYVEKAGDIFVGCGYYK